MSSGDDKAISGGTKENQQTESQAEVEIGLSTKNVAEKSGSEENMDVNLNVPKDNLQVSEQGHSSRLQKDSDADNVIELEIIDNNRQQHGPSGLEYHYSVPIQLYQGELMPPGDLHGIKSFGAVFHANEGDWVDTPGDPIAQAMNVIRGKFNQLRRSQRFHLDNFNSFTEIGDGTFGKVFRATNMLDNNPVAIKQFRPNMRSSSIYKEVHMLIALQHKRVVNLLGAFHDMGSYIVTELGKGSLRANITRISKVQTLRFSIQLLEAIQHMHEMNVVHLDLKPDNCLITSQNNLVICDFGSAQLLPKDVCFIHSDRNKPPLGCFGYNDVLANKCTYSKSTDIFSAGAIIFEMDTGKYLSFYPDWDAPVSEYIRNLQEGRLVKHPPPKLTIGSETRYDTSGERQPLKLRYDASRFKTVLDYMVIDTSERISAADILDKHIRNNTFFDEVFLAHGLSWGQIDNDLRDIEDVTLDVYRPSTFLPQKCNRKTNLAMHLIYYDNEQSSTESSAQSVVSVPPATEAIQPPKVMVQESSEPFSALMSDDVIQAVQELIEKKGIRAQRIMGDEFRIVDEQLNVTDGGVEDFDMPKALVGVGSATVDVSRRDKADNVRKTNNPLRSPTDPAMQNIRKKSENLTKPAIKKGQKTLRQTSPPVILSDAPFKLPTLPRGKNPSSSSQSKAQKLSVSLKRRKGDSKIDQSRGGVDSSEEDEEEGNVNADNSTYRTPASKRTNENETRPDDSKRPKITSFEENDACSVLDSGSGSGSGSRKRNISTPQTASPNSNELGHSSKLDKNKDIVLEHASDDTRAKVKNKSNFSRSQTNVKKSLNKERPNYQKPGTSAGKKKGNSRAANLENKPAGESKWNAAYRKKYHWPANYEIPSEDWDGIFYCKYCGKNFRDYEAVKDCQKKCKKSK